MLQAEPYSLPAEQKAAALAALVERVKTAGRGKKYDCIIGVSGGADSSYVAYMVKKLGLRALAVHFDNGWDTELAQKNIEGFLKKLDIDLFTYVMDWEIFRDLQLSFLKASTPDSEIPTDHAIVALLHQMARKHGVRYILAGTNLSTETILPRRWSHGHGDWKYIYSLQKQFGTKSLRGYPHQSFVGNYFDQTVRRIEFVSFLDYIPYIKSEAVATLIRDVDWKDYGGKHHESAYTKFYQCYILPKKFGYDKRRMHLSSLICAGQMTRDQALQELAQPLYREEDLRQDMPFFLNKMELSETQFEAIMQESPKTFWDYPSYESTTWLQSLVHVYGRLFRR